MPMVSTYTPIFHGQATKQFLFLTLLAGGLIVALFRLEGRVGLNLGDEGFLWYGAQRVMLGEVPIRDFVSYDPGRYYWSAAIMRLVGNNGIVTLRIAVAIFQVVGLSLSLFLLARTAQRRNILLLILAASTIVLWMFPRHKLFDITLSISLVATLAYLIEQPSLRRYFLTGLVVGLVATFGRNHGLYGAIGSVGAIVYLRFGRDGASLLSVLKWWLAGVSVGYLPVILLLAVVPGFPRAFWESILFWFECKCTNIPLPIPWPWNVPFGQMHWLESVRGVLVGLFFIGTLTFGLLGLGYVIRAGIRNAELPPLVVASAVMTLPYAHHAFSRAGISHLAQGIFPLLIGVFALLAGRTTKVGISGGTLLFAASLLIMLPMHPGWQSHRSANWVTLEVAGTDLEVDPGTAKKLGILKGLVDMYAPEGRTFIVAPLWPAAYAVFERKAPMWGFFALLPRSAAFQKAEIQRIREANPGFALILDHALDGRDELRFRNSYPLIDQYIRENFEAVQDPSADGELRIYRSKRTVFAGEQVGEFGRAIGIAHLKCEWAVGVVDSETMEAKVVMPSPSCQVLDKTKEA
jgi:hypothetical protein